MLWCSLLHDNIPLPSEPLQRETEKKERAKIVLIYYEIKQKLKIWLMNVHDFGLTEMALHSWTLVLLKLGDSVTEESNGQLLTSQTHAYKH